MTNRIMAIVPALLALAVTACGDNIVPNYNAGSIGDLENSPTPTSLATASQGLLFGMREDMEFYTIVLGSMGREGYSLTPSDAGWRRNLETMLPSFYSTSFTAWREHYRNIRQANTILHGVETVSGLTDAQKEGFRGYVKTIQAFDFLVIINTRNEGGAPIDVDRDIGGEPAPIASKEEVFRHIVKLLDEGKAHLEKAGPAFRLQLGPGFTGFTTPPTFLKFNRALRARVAVYTNDWAGALTALEQSFVDSNGDFALGAYHSWSSNSGDRSLAWLFDPSGNAIRVQKDFKREAQLRADGSPDLRFTRKTQLRELRTFQGVGSEYRFTLYESPAAFIPIIRNEELVLLRAEANIGLGNRAAAIQDLNTVRVRSGGLEPLAAGFTGDLLKELLYNKRYSLVWEGGHRWIDMRHYNRLNELPKERPADRVFTRIPLPEDDCLPRNPKPAGCEIPAGS